MFDYAIGHARIDETTGRKIKRCGLRGSRNRRHIIRREKSGVVYTYHATKGWRVTRD